jgi:hypothetical protein
MNPAAACASDRLCGDTVRGYGELATLRQNIEGQAYPYDPAVIPDHHGYDQMNQFEQIVNQVGEENAKAAYFKGEVDKIAMPAA